MSGYLKGRMDKNVRIGLTIETFQPSASRVLGVYYRQEKKNKFNMALSLLQVCRCYFQTTQFEHIQVKKKKDLAYIYYFADRVSIRAVIDVRLILVCKPLKSICSLKAFSDRKHSWSRCTEAEVSKTNKLGGVGV